MGVLVQQLGGSAGSASVTTDRAFELRRGGRWLPHGGHLLMFSTCFRHGGPVLSVWGARRMRRGMTGDGCQGKGPIGPPLFSGRSNRSYDRLEWHSPYQFD